MRKTRFTDSKIAFAFRHTFASHLVMGGADLIAVKELLGHKTLQMTLRYSHLSQSHKKQAVETVAGVLSGHYMDTELKKAVNARIGTNA